MLDRVLKIMVSKFPGLLILRHVWHTQGRLMELIPLLRLFKNRILLAVFRLVVNRKLD